MLEGLTQRLTQNRRDFVWSLLLALIFGYISIALFMGGCEDTIATIPSWAYPPFMILNGGGFIVSFFIAIGLLMQSIHTLITGGSSEL